MNKGILSSKDNDITVTVKGENGSSITYKSPTGSQMDMKGILGGMVDGFSDGGMVNGNAPSPVADNKQIMVTPGEFVVNQPAAQKYAGILDKINNEGKQMLAQGGWTHGGQMKPNHYAQGGGIHSTPNELYDMLQEDLPYIEEMIKAGKPVSDVAQYYVSSWGLAPTDTTYETIGSVYDELKGIGGYATDSTPITASANPQKKAMEFAQNEGLMNNPTTMGILQGAVREAVQDWSTLPQHEKSEWGSIDELISYYLTDTATETGLYDGHYKDDVYATGGKVEGYAFGGSSYNPNANDMQYSPSNDAINLNKLRQRIADAKSPVEADALAAELMSVLKQLRGDGYWSGGEVEGEVSKGATPAEGDSITVKGNTFYWTNGKWSYKSGTAAPKWAMKGINNTLGKSTVPTTQSIAGQSDTSGSSNPTAELDKETHAKNAGWAKRAIEAEKVIRELNAQGYNPASLARSKQEFFAGLVGGNDLFRDEKGQRYQKAIESLVAAVLRKDTGAAIAHNEFERTYRQLFPAFGTGRAAQEDVANQRKQNIESFIDASGPKAGELTAQLGKLFDEPATNDSAIFTGEDIGGAVGGTLGAVLGSFFGPAGTVAGGAGGTYAGRSVGQWISQPDATIVDSLTPEINDVIDTVLGGVGGGLGKLGHAGYKAVKAGLARALAKTGGKVTEEMVKDLAEQQVKKVVAAKLGGGSIGKKVSERIAPEIAKGLTPAQQILVNYGSKPFQVLDGKVMDLTTGKQVFGKLANDVLKQASTQAASKGGAGILGG